MKKLALIASVILLGACASHSQKNTLNKENSARLVSITQSLPAEQQARYAARHPVETLSFFGVKPGDTVIEVLPGDGWYSKILVPYLGKNGQLIGVDYNLDLWPKFGSWVNTEFMEGRKRWPAEWSGKAKAWGGADGATAQAYTFATLPAGLTGKVDSVLFIRALHNLANFENDGGYLTQALAETKRVLKPGGVVGIVQHAMSEEKPDDWASGKNGYLKRSRIVSFMEKAGFEFVAESDINKNPKDDPQAGENVWRLPPSLDARDADKEKYRAIGESNRVTLLFRKK
ncbi:class I SAM-dependent methyltransferase [Cellvibrio mixtus]|uniref:class I SAM-dependent methyltransferase n=1 Tax=Cellvibrio mixtus TaxID=39650 RepID=UPI00058651A3|nr:class I SAM-dependent methyltransferase [Cellvibrio mixtus]